MFLNEILFNTKLEIDHKNSTIDKAYSKRLSLFLTTLVCYTSDLVRKLKSTYWCLHVVPHALHNLFRRFYLHLFFTLFSFLFYETCQCLLLLCSFLNIDSSLCNDLDEIVVSVIGHDCFWASLLNVIDVHGEIIHVCNTNSSGDIELLETFAKIFYFVMRHLSA